MIEPTRRRFITGLASLIAAPAIVRASSLMPVRVLPVDPGTWMTMDPWPYPYGRSTGLLMMEYYKGLVPADWRYTIRLSNIVIDDAQQFRGIPIRVP